MSTWPPHTCTPLACSHSIYHPLLPDVLVFHNCHDKTDQIAYMTEIVFSALEARALRSRQQPTAWFHLKGSLLGLWMDSFSLCTHKVFFFILANLLFFPISKFPFIIRKAVCPKALQNNPINLITSRCYLQIKSYFKIIGV